VDSLWYTGLVQASLRPRWGPRLDRLSAVDASNLVLEHGAQTSTIGLVGVLEAAGLVDGTGQPDLARLRAVLGPRVRAIPRLCQRVQPTRWGEGRPVWVDCPVDLSRHIRALPPVAGREGFTTLCGQLLSVRLPRDRPLWDLLVVPGVDPDHLGVVLRVHHAVADGLSLVRLAAELFDPPEGSDGAAPAPPRPANPPPTRRDLRLDALAGLIAGLRYAAGAAARQLRQPAVAVANLRRTARRVAGTTARQVPRTSLLGPLGVRRRVFLLGADLEPLRRSAHAAGGTLNDALLAAVAEGARAILAARGERSDITLPVSVPVSLRGTAAGSASGGNLVGVMVVPLPLAEPDPHRRLSLIAAATRAQKPTARAAGTLELSRARWATRLLDLLSRRQRVIALFVTNVPGPGAPLRLAGARMSRAWPMSVIAGNVRFGVAAASYAGWLSVTAVCDADSAPDARVFADAVQSALTRLASA